MLNGTEILNITQTDPRKIPKINKKVIKWQAMNRSGTKEQLMEYIKSNYSK